MKKTVLSILSFTLIALAVNGQDLPNPPANLQTLPVGSYVIPMDNTLQNNVALGSNGKFNLRAYGLICHLLNYNVKIKWVIKSGKAKDAADFTATAQMFKPTLEGTANSRSFISGPFVIFAQDTLGVASLITDYYTQKNLTNHLRPKVFRTTTATSNVDIRYDLTGFKPKAAILNDGGNEEIHVGYMVAAAIPNLNYSISDGVSLQENCFTFASEPHNDEEGPEVDSAIVHIKSFVLSGRNFLAECKAVITYENNPLGRFQTTTGIDDVNRNLSTNVNWPYPDLSFYQIQGSYNASSGGSVKNWEVITSQNTTNMSKATGTGANANVQAATMSKMTSSGRGGLVFYIGNHEFDDNNEAEINGIRMYMNAFLTPVAPNAYCETIPEEVLAVKLQSFNGQLENNRVTLNWNIADNQLADKFEIERSNDGTSFSTAGLVFATDNSGIQAYQFPQLMNGDVVYYRLKMIEKTGVTGYSKVLVFRNLITRNNNLKILNNPATDKITLNFDIPNGGLTTISVTDLTGRQVLQQRIKSTKGINQVSIPLPSLKNGMYVVDVFDGTTHMGAKFIKQ